MVAQPDVTLTTLEMLLSDWAYIVAAKTNPDIQLFAWT